MHAQFIVCSDDKLMTHLEDAIEVDSERLVLVEKYLADAIEVNVDALLTPKAMWWLVVWWSMGVEEQDFHVVQAALILMFELP